jgi:hypothetical protein
MIIFPGKACQSLVEIAQHAYYITHYEHVKNYLKHIDTISIIDDWDSTIATEFHNNNFATFVANQKVIFDYSDHLGTMDFNSLKETVPYFKFHTTIGGDTRCIPFPPMSFPDWDAYYDLIDKIHYNPTGSIFYKCRIYGGAIERRTAVLDALKSYNGLPVDFDFVDQSEYFTSLNNCRINVIMPGSRIDILDRTHLQSFAFGIPVITPNITTLLPYNKIFEPNTDYIECSPDGSDILELIEKYKDDKVYLDFISNNCKTKFAETCTLDAVKIWIESHL